MKAVRSVSLHIKQPQCRCGRPGRVGMQLAQLAHILSSPGVDAGESAGVQDA